MCKLFLLLLLVTVSTTAHLYAQSVLHTAKQVWPEAALTNIDARGQCVFKLAEQTQTVPANQIVRWSSQQPTTPSPAVALADGSWLAGQLQWTTERRLRVVSKWFEAVELDIDTLRAIIANPSPSWPETQLLQSQMLAVTGSQDVLWKRDAESVSGIVTIQLKKSLDTSEPDRAVWSLKAPTASLAAEVPPSDVAGVAFSPILRRSVSPNRTCFRINLIDGSSLLIKEMKHRDDQRIELVLASGQSLVSLDEADQFPLSIAQITAQPAGVTWLSDMEPARYRLLDSDSRAPWPLGRNQDLFGKRLFDTRGQAIDHALVIHSPAQVAYRWDGQAARLMATLEILETSGAGSSSPPLGSAQCQVLVGREGQLVKVWQSETIRAGQPPVLVEAELTNAQLIVLLVDQADLGTMGDHVLWRDGRLVTP